MSKSKPSRTSRASSAAKYADKRTPQTSPPPTVPAGWLVGAGILVVVAAFVCAWGTLCILFWQGSWQLLYHPVSSVTRTPASANLAFESVGFATNASGEAQLRGWWIPAAKEARYTAIVLHGATGNLGDTVDSLMPLHDAGLNIFAFDYRGYGQSHFAHPSEARWREDADSAIKYLTDTRHVASSSIVVVGRELGGNLALEVGDKHPDLAGVVIEQPLESPTTAIFNDPRARLVPVHMLVRDQWDTMAAASNLRIPSLWFYWTPAHSTEADAGLRAAYEKVSARKMLVWLTDSNDEPKQFETALKGWLDQLQSRAQ